MLRFEDAAGRAGARSRRARRRRGRVARRRARGRRRPRSSSGPTRTATPAVTKVANVWAPEQGRERHGRAEGARPDPRGSQDRPGRHRPRRHRRCARLDRRARRQRLGRPAVPVAGDAEAVPRVRARTRSRTAPRSRSSTVPRSRSRTSPSSRTRSSRRSRRRSRTCEKQALAAKKKTGAQVGLSVQQGADGDAYHMYPLFSGLCGYVFGTNSAGNLDPSDDRRREREVPQERGA